MEANISFPLANGDDKRILVIDILRGFALFGIIINHITASFLAGPAPASNPDYNIFGTIDGGFDTASFILTFGKFFSVFSFLFGISFAIQMDRASKKGKSFTGRFIWRLVILFLIGFIHNLFFSGDILVVYAALGLFLIPARYLGDKVLLFISILMILNTPGFIAGVGAVNSPPPTEAQIKAQTEQRKGFAKMSEEQYKIKQSGSLVEVVKLNFSNGLVIKFFFQFFSGRLWITSGLFLLGLWAGRKRIFENNSNNTLFFKRLLYCSAAIALISSPLGLKFGSPFGGATTWVQLLGNLAFNIHQASLSSLYVAAIVLIYWHTGFSKVLNNLSCLGRMGLTTYLTQSIFGVILFYGFGFGMLGKLGVAASIGIGVVFFFIQIVFANWWMSRFCYGIVEWLWRSLTFMNLQPLRKEHEHREVESVPA